MRARRVEGKEKGVDVVGRYFFTLFCLINDSTLTHNCSSFLNIFFLRSEADKEKIIVKMRTNNF